MCGLVGVVGDISHGEKKAFETMLYIDAIRGHHSTGVVSGSLSRPVEWLKKAVTAVDFLDLKATDKLLSKPTCALLGHNRYATKGVINSTNAHPFEFGSIVGMHNGTLTRQNLLPDSEKFDVDSENIYYSMDKIGVKQTLSKVAGAAALVWWNDDESTVNIWRNSQRTLYGMYSKDKRLFMYASEKAMLDLVVSQDRTKIANTKWEEAEPIPVETLIKIECVPIGKPLVQTEEKVIGFRAPTVTVTATRTATTTLTKDTGQRSIASVRANFPLNASVVVENLTYNHAHQRYQGNVVGKPSATVRINVKGYCPFSWLDQLSEPGSVWKGKVCAHVYEMGGYDLELDSSKESSLKRVEEKKNLEGYYYLADWDYHCTKEEWDDWFGKEGCGDCGAPLATPYDVGLWDVGVPICKNCQ